MGRLSADLHTSHDYGAYGERQLPSVEDGQKLSLDLGIDQRLKEMQRKLVWNIC